MFMSCFVGSEGPSLLSSPTSRSSCPDNAGVQWSVLWLHSGWQETSWLQVRGMMSTSTDVIVDLVKYTTHEGNKHVWCPGLAWMVIPSTSTHFFLGSLDFKSWRLFVVLCSFPALTSAVVFRLIMPESPKFLMEVIKVHAEASLSRILSVWCLMHPWCSTLCFLQADQEKEAIDVFRLMFEINMKGKGKSFPVWMLIYVKAHPYLDFFVIYFILFCIFCSSNVNLTCAGIRSVFKL